MAGSQPPNGGHGRSLLPLIDDPSSSWRDHLVVEFGGVNNLSATLRTLVTDRLKYGYSAGHGDQLYDLERDPHELVNVATDPAYRDRLDDARRTLSDWMETHGDPVRGIYNEGLRHHLHTVGSPPFARKRSGGQAASPPKPSA